MTTRQTLINLFAVILLLTSVGAASAQDDGGNGYSYTPANMWEFGFGVGHVFSSGDLDYDLGYGGEIHFRRALDYIFSLRGEISYQKIKGKRDENRTFPDPATVLTAETDFINANLTGIVTLNNFRWDRSTADKKWGPYVYGGVGVGYVSGEKTLNDGTDNTFNILDSEDDGDVVANAIGGAGLSYKISPRFNISLDHQITLPFGRQADLFDGFENEDDTRTSYRDVIHLTTLRFNFNLGSFDKRSEPLYWISPGEGIIKNLDDLNARPVFDLTDTDGDGVIDMVDQENDTPVGSPVDTKGIALDSDGDGVKDYEDQEPFSQPGYSVDSKGIASIPNYVTNDEVAKAIDEALKNFRPIGTSSSIADWFLPMVHFNNDSYSIRTSDYPSLKSIATVMNNNPSVRVLVRGFTDKTSSDKYNTVLSYNRAKSAIEYLVSTYGVPRDRFVLQYGGEDQTIVPTNGSNLINRRVEFSVANGETEMPQPSGRAGRGTFGGNRSSGY